MGILPLRCGWDARRPAAGTAALCNASRLDKSFKLTHYPNPPQCRIVDLPRCKMRSSLSSRIPSMPQEEKTSVIRDRQSADRQSDDRYDAHRIESKWFEHWQQDPALYAAEPHSTKP